MTLDVRGLTVRFGAFTALDTLDFHVGTDELRFVIGPNGAGKTTLIDSITGRVAPASGTVRLDEVELTRLREQAIARLGIGRTFQTPTVFEALTVQENVDLALRRRRRLLGLLRSTTAAERRAASETLDAVGLAGRASDRAATLSHGERKWLEIGMLLAQRSRVLLLDEPVAGMTEPERERTAVLLVSLSPGRTIVVVEHDMAFVRSIAHTVTVLHEGRRLVEGDVSEVQSDPDVARIYLGRTDESEEVRT